MPFEDNVVCPGTNFVVGQHNYPGKGKNNYSKTAVNKKTGQSPDSNVCCCFSMPKDTSFLVYLSNDFALAFIVL